MSDVKKASLIKKPLKVAVEEPSTELSSDPVEEQNIQASKKEKVKKTPEEIKETRLANLAKGQAGLKKRQEENRQKKAELESAAIEKKLRLAAKQKKNIEDSYGVSLDESSDEEVLAPIPAPKRKVVVAAPAALPKKKPIRYVEQPESESEEEIVYVKRQAPAAKKGVQSLPQIMFY